MIGSNVRAPYDGLAVLGLLGKAIPPLPVGVITESVANQLARNIWTFDGLPYPLLNVRSNCGASTCSVEMAAGGGPDDRMDAYSFDIGRSTGAVTPGLVNLGAYPSDIDETVDALARRLVPSAQLEGIQFRGARWLSPPDAGTFVLQYDDGGNEGHPRTFVTLDARYGRLIDVRVDTR